MPQRSKPSKLAMPVRSRSPAPRIRSLSPLLGRLDKLWRSLKRARLNLSRPLLSAPGPAARARPAVGPRRLRVPAGARDQPVWSARRDPARAEDSRRVCPPRPPPSTARLRFGHPSLLPLYRRRPALPAARAGATRPGHVMPWYLRFRSVIKRRRTVFSRRGDSRRFAGSSARDGWRCRSTMWSTDTIRRGPAAPRRTR